jgi:hypothetical protein
MSKKTLFFISIIATTICITLSILQESLMAVCGWVLVFILETVAYFKYQEKQEEEARLTKFFLDFNVGQRQYKLLGKTEVSTRELEDEQDTNELFLHVKDYFNLEIEEPIFNTVAATRDDRFPIYGVVVDNINGHRFELGEIVECASAEDLTAERWDNETDYWYLSPCEVLILD